MGASGPGTDREPTARPGPAVGRLAVGLRARWVARRGRAARFPWPVRLCESAVTVRGLARGPREVVLRALARSDEEAWMRLRLADDARLRPWEATLPPGAGEEPQDFGVYVRAQNRLARRGEAMPWVIEVDGRLAGQLMVAPIRWGSVRAATLGYWIGGPWEGRGVMTLALAMALDHLLGPEVGLHRVEVDVRPGNARSLAVCRRLGLPEEGVRRGLMHINGAWEDHLGFAILAEDLAGRPGFVEALAPSRRDRRT